MKIELILLFASFVWAAGSGWYFFLWKSDKTVKREIVKNPNKKKEDVVEKRVMKKKDPISPPSVESNPIEVKIDVDVDYEKNDFHNADQEVTYSELMGETKNEAEQKKTINPTEPLDGDILDISDHNFNI